MDYAEVKAAEAENDIREGRESVPVTIGDLGAMAAAYKEAALRANQIKATLAEAARGAARSAASES